MIVEHHAEDEKNVELDYELLAVLANVTKSAARSTVSQTKRGHGFVAWQAVVDGFSPNSSSDPAIALQPILATPRRWKDAEEFKEKLTAWSLKVAEKEHLFEENNGEAHQAKQLRTGPRKFGEIIEQLEIINATMADDGPRPTDLVSFGTQDARTTKSDQDASNDMPFYDVRAVAWRRYKADKRSRQERTTQSRDVASWKSS